eukprot:403365464
MEEPQLKFKKRESSQSPNKNKSPYKVPGQKTGFAGLVIDQLKATTSQDVSSSNLHIPSGQLNEKKIDDIYDGGVADFGAEVIDEVEEQKLIAQDEVRISNIAFSKKKVSEFVSCYFAILGVGCTIVASEINFFYNLDDKNKEHVQTMLIIANVSTLFLILSIVASNLLYIQWKKTKSKLAQLDNLINTGLWKQIILEVLLSLVMSYPSLYGSTYIETANDFSNGRIFITNDLLLCFMIFCRVHFFVRGIIQLSFYTNPRAQRVCHIYGIDATNSFALKSIMIDYSWLITAVSAMISLFILAYSIRLFERQLQQNFYHITTSMWYVLITMTTVGYGDVYAMSHAGRAIAIICAFIGVMIVSMFVVCLYNILQFDQSQEKSFNLLERLQLKDFLRIYAVGMLASTYKIKILRRKIREARHNYELDRKLRHQLKMLKRQFQNYQQNFQKISKNLKNISDPIADMENLKRNIFTTAKDVEEIKLNMPRLFSFKSNDQKDEQDLFSQKDLERITSNIHRRGTKKRLLQAIPHRSQV